MPIRFDKACTIRKVDTTDEGYLLITAPIAKSSIYSYRLDDGSIQREYIPSETLFNQDSINTLKLKPVTNNHPKKFVKRDSYSKLAIGTTGENIGQDGEYLVATFIVSDSKAIDAINSGKNQLSPAYECDVVLEHGITPEGERYDAIQKNRRYNHLALVDRARGGNDLTFRLDSDDSIIPDTINERGDSPMPKINLDGIDHELDNPAIATHIAKLTAKVDSLEGEITANKTALVQAKADSDGLTAELTKLRADSTSEKIDGLVKARVALIEAAKPILGKDFKADASDLDIMQAVVLKQCPEAKFDGYTGEMAEVYTKARFDGVIAQIAEAPVASQRQNIRTKSADGQDANIPLDPRQARIDSLGSRYEGTK